ncbi:hypothetical protein IscW_ISCW009794 [Ixodes scapularis]|uniref:Uncharacterized protein n=1 Tax=Ixodes scapularis TaxID=6945 RepID=B7Q011_IXOSC|nr:hypothetical protein IscW_ISCW009794 [Ixodes scapularis]|eukprot:XP_002406695.1 hypothetical protein IscW_ISCW009794 [Ixodes scapularis]
MKRLGKNIMLLELTGSEPVVLDSKRISVTAFPFTLKSVEEIANQLLSSGTASQGTIDTTADTKDNEEADHLAMFYGLGESALSVFSSEVGKSVGGFVSWQLTKTRSCTSCVIMMLDDRVAGIFVRLKNNGGLVYP